MRAVAYQNPLPISAESALIDVDLPMPEASGRDLLVEIKAVSVNPVDTKVRAGVIPDAGQYKVLGWDAAGIVEATGAEVTMFKPGDEVYYAGAIDRGGSNAEFHLVDERIVALKPKVSTSPPLRPCRSPPSRLMRHCSTALRCRTRFQVLRGRS